MTLNLLLAINIAKVLHSIISLLFLIIALWLIIRSTRGILKNKPYIDIDKWLAYGFIINLYLQLIFGLILFSNLNLGNDYANGSLTLASKRLWPVEHIVLMLFALFIANLGLIFSQKTSVDKDKHKKVLSYYTVSILLIAISLMAIYVF